MLLRLPWLLPLLLLLLLWLLLLWQWLLMVVLGLWWCMRS